MRPKYETDHDIKNERLVADALANIGVEVYEHQNHTKINRICLLTVLND